MLPVEIIPASLQPYPDDPTQDAVVNVVSTISAIYDKIADAVSLPFEVISKAYTSILEVASSRDFQGRPINLRPRLPGDTASFSFAKTPVLTYDNKFNYLIHEGKLWFRPLGVAKEAKWKELGVNGNPSQHPLIAVSADGDNLIVIDDHHQLFYVKTNQIVVTVFSGCPKWSVTQENLSWIRQFYTFPLFSLIINKMEDTALDVANLRHIFVTHKGEETMYYVDMSGKKIADPCGTSTIHAESLDGLRHYIGDPYVRQRLTMEIVGPEEGRFVSDNSTGAASTKMVIQRGHNRDGTPFHHCYTRFIEADELITAYPHTYDINNRTPLVRFFPGENWIKQPTIPMLGKSKLTNRIGMMQTGRGQSQRILFWEGASSDGTTTGFYAKFIYEPQWRFISTRHEIDPEDFLSVEGIRQGPRIAFDYSSDFSSDLVKSVQLKNFISENKTERAPNTTLEFVLPNQQRYTMRLHQLKGLKYVFGFSDRDDHWTLIAPREMADAAEVRQMHQWMTEGAASVKVNVEEDANSVRLFYPDRFDFRFVKQNEEQEVVGLLSSQLGRI